MFDKMIKINDASFPKSFWLLQQEAILANSCILTGFEFMIKGGFDDRDKGHYYTSFFQTSIGIERILKLILISNYMLQNSYQSPNEEKIRKYGHDLIELYKEVQKISSKYEGCALQELGENSIRKNMFFFMNSFAAATGRYFNISNIETVRNIDPLVSWKLIVDQIKREDFSEGMHFRIETEVANRLNPNLQIQDIFENTGYVSSVYNRVLVSKVNYYAVWNTLELVRPLIKILAAISWKSHEMDTNAPTPSNNFPHIPYYDEIFLILYTSRRDALRRKRWTDLGI
jgi:hypothetical protein